MESWKRTFTCSNRRGSYKKKKKHMVCKLHRSIYGLKQAFRSWNIRFDQVIKSFSFKKALMNHACTNGFKVHLVVFLVLYIDDILVIGNSVKVLSDVKGYLKK